MNSNGICLFFLAYGAWMYHTEKAKSETRDFGPLWLCHIIRAILKTFMRLLGITWSVRFSIPVTKGMSFIKHGAIGTVSPHGCYSFAALFLGIPSFRCDPIFRELRVSIIAASVLFYVPIVREYLLLFGVREATRENIVALVKDGRIVALNPGGIWEQVHTRHDQEQVFAQNRRGFIRIALELGIPLLPMYGKKRRHRLPSHILHHTSNLIIIRLLPQFLPAEVLRCF